jgi:hypothetical protein
LTGRSITVASLALVALGFGATDALARPSVSLSLPASADAGAPISLAYAFRGLPRADRRVVQRQEGVARAWHTVRTLRATAGSASIAGLPLGLYTLRVAALARNGRVAIQKQRTLKVFGTVPLSTLMSGLNAFNDGRNGTYATPTGTFDYVFAFPLFGVAPEPIAPVEGANNFCRALQLVFVPGRADSAADPSQWSASISIVQAKLDPVSASAVVNATGSLNAQLVPGTSWSISVAQTTGSPTQDDAIFVSGSGQCDRAVSLWTLSSG